MIDLLTTTPRNKRDLAEAAGTTPREVELAINEARRQGVPIVSDSDGYRLAKDASEVRECARRLRSRAVHIMETAQALDKAADAMTVTLWGWLP